ncbi:hypothetical protein AMS68_002744 [Peltaster fructicola]|uniref:Aminoglycoside phosphotransferase domain-containing protein n=1 Tax=Peltaster fructicola TaxID=286661 RepID=A0A6H0XR41_9PEZI|nr:hypothetical protein AMS68_002744 [Peltaster fructicola]
MAHRVGLSCMPSLALHLATATFTPLAHILLGLSQRAQHELRNGKINAIRAMLAGVFHLLGNTLAALAAFTSRGPTSALFIAKNDRAHQRLAIDLHPTTNHEIECDTSDDSYAETSSMIFSEDDAKSNTDATSYGEPPTDDINGDDDQHSVDGSDRASSSSHSFVACDPSEDFVEVLSRLNQNAVPQLCQRIRHGLPLTRTTIICNEATNAQPEIIVQEPSFGTFHAVFPILFEDDTKWILKVPRSGNEAEWHESEGLKMLAEVNTMIMLRKETTIPVPQVHSYDASLHNAFGCPYIIMDFVEGVSLGEHWYNKSPDFDVQRFRQTALQDIAKAMAQLDRYSSATSGCPVFDDDGQIVGTAALRIPNIRACLNRGWQPDLETIYCDSPALTDVSQWFRHLLDQNYSDAISSGTDNKHTTVMWLIRKLIDWMPQPNDDPRDKFVLSHPDFDVQNILVSEDGHLLSIIDWDGVTFAPRSVGYEKFPMFLTTDYDPASYEWEDDKEDEDQDDPAWVDSPETLAMHRQQYAQYMRAALLEVRKESSSLDHVFFGRSSLPSYTASSPLAEAVFHTTFAGNDATARHILSRLLSDLSDAHFRNAMLKLGLHDEASIAAELKAITASVNQAKAQPISDDEDDSEIVKPLREKRIYEPFDTVRNLNKGEPMLHKLAMMKADWQMAFDFS